MSDWKVIVRVKPSFPDHHGEAVKKEWGTAGLKGLKSVRTGQAYALSNAAEADARRLAEKLLTDPVTQDAEVLPAEGKPQGVLQAQVWPKTGVSDPVADTVRLAARDLGIAADMGVRSGQVYDFSGVVRAEDVRRFCEEHLMNALVQRVEVL